MTDHCPPKADLEAGVKVHRLEPDRDRSQAGGRDAEWAAPRDREVAAVATDALAAGPNIPGGRLRIRCARRAGQVRVGPASDFPYPLRPILYPAEELPCERGKAVTLTIATREVLGKNGQRPAPGIAGPDLSREFGPGDLDRGLVGELNGPAGTFVRNTRWPLKVGTRSGWTSERQATCLERIRCWVSTLTSTSKANAAGDWPA